MNLMRSDMKLDPATTKLVHCSNCNNTFADKRIPKYCPVCGAEKKKLAKATNDECESFMEDYRKALEHDMNLIRSKQGIGSGEQETGNLSDPLVESPVTHGPDTAFEDFGPDYDIGPDEYGLSCDSFDPGYDEPESWEEDIFEPIGYDPEEIMNSMPASRKISGYETKNLLAAAETSVREKKWAMQRAGLKTDDLYSVLQDIRQNAGKLGRNIPRYTNLMLMMYVDHSLQAELRHPRNNRTYTKPDITHMLQELGIRPVCWDSYYETAGIRN